MYPLLFLAGFSIFVIRLKFAGMKKFAAGLLLVAISFHLIGSYVGMRILYPVAYERSMNQTERAIARALEEETGVWANIVQLHEDQLLPKKGMGYGTYFVFSCEIKGKTVHYRIESDPVKLKTRVSVRINSNDRELQPDNRALLSQLFAKFKPEMLSLQRTCLKRNSVSGLLTTASLHATFSPAVPTPPPERG